MVHARPALNEDKDDAGGSAVVLLVISRDGDGDSDAFGIGFGDDGKGLLASDALTPPSIFPLAMMC